MKKSKKLLIALTAISLAVPMHVQSKGHLEPTIVETASNAGVFNTLLAAATAAGIVDWVESEAPKTLFAPTDDAFAALPEGTVESLLLPENKAQLIQILHYHFVEGEVLSTDLKNGYVETVARAGLKVNVGNTVTLNDSVTVTSADIEASNGIIHIIDSVLLPPSSSITDLVVATPTLSTLLAAVQAAGLGDVLITGRPFTVFAPTDEAFAALPEGTLESLLLPENLDTLTNILLYHVFPGSIYSGQLKDGPIGMLNGGTVTVNTGAPAFEFEGGSASPVAVDIMANNGVVHLVDTVLLPGSNDIVAALAADGRFSTLLSVATAAGIAGDLSTLSHITLFAPTDDAFAALPAATLAVLTDPANVELLKNVLLYHVVSGNQYASMLSSGVYNTAAGARVPITVTDSGVWVNTQASVIQANLIGSNGVIHVVDNVILPPQMIGTTLERDGRFNTLVAALKAANLFSVLDAGDPLTIFAPTDEAFAKLPAGTVNSLLLPENIGTLTAILTAHVVAGNKGAGDLLSGSVATLQGKEITLKTDHGILNLDTGATVLQSDLPAWNGTIHVINEVIIP